MTPQKPVVNVPIVLRARIKVLPSASVRNPPLVLMNVLFACLVIPLTAPRTKTGLVPNFALIVALFKVIRCTHPKELLTTDPALLSTMCYVSTLRFNANGAVLRRRACFNPMTVVPLRLK